MAKFETSASSSSEATDDASDGKTPSYRYVPIPPLPRPEASALAAAKEQSVLAERPAPVVRPPLEQLLRAQQEAADKDDEEIGDGKGKSKKKKTDQQPAQTHVETPVERETDKHQLEKELEVEFAAEAEKAETDLDPALQKTFDDQEAKLADQEAFLDQPNGAEKWNPDQGAGVEVYLPPDPYAREVEFRAADEAEEEFARSRSAPAPASELLSEREESSKPETAPDATSAETAHAAQSSEQVETEATDEVSPEAAAGGSGHEPPKPPVDGPPHASEFGDKGGSVPPHIRYPEVSSGPELTGAINPSSAPETRTVHEVSRGGLKGWWLGLGLEYVFRKRADKKLERKIQKQQLKTNRQYEELQAKHARQQQSFDRYRQEQQLAQPAQPERRGTDHNTLQSPLFAQAANQAPRPEAEAQRPTKANVAPVAAAETKASEPETERPIKLQPNQRLKRESWYSYITNEKGEVVPDAIEYGDALRHEQRQEALRDKMAQENAAAAAGDFAAIRGGINPSQPAGSANSSASPTNQSADAQHRLPAHSARQQIAANLQNPWFWLLLVFLIIVFFSAAVFG